MYWSCFLCCQPCTRLRIAYLHCQSAFRSCPVFSGTSPAPRPLMPWFCRFSEPMPCGFNTTLCLPSSTGKDCCSLPFNVDKHAEAEQLAVSWYQRYLQIVDHATTATSLTLKTFSDQPRMVGVAEILACQCMKVNITCKQSYPCTWRVMLIFISTCLFFSCTVNPSRCVSHWMLSLKDCQRPSGKYCSILILKNTHLSGRNSTRFYYFLVAIF